MYNVSCVYMTVSAVAMQEFCSVVGADLFIVFGVEVVSSVCIDVTIFVLLCYCVSVLVSVTIYITGGVG